MYLVFPKSLFSIAICLLCVICGSYVTKINTVTQRTADIRVAWLVCLTCLRSHVLRAYCNFESKQANSITLFGRRPNDKANNTFLNSLRKNELKLKPKLKPKLKELGSPVIDVTVKEGSLLVYVLNFFGISAGRCGSVVIRERD